MTKDPTDTETEYPAKVRSNRTFISYDSNKTTNLVKNYTNQISGVNGSRTANFVYAYDANGKIVSRKTTGTLSALVELNTYVYDEAGQLVREDKSTKNTWLYEYDANGNITQRKTYNYTVAGTEPTTLISTDTFSYASNGWEDRLVSYNGQPIVYDNIGNPTTYLGATLTWHGRELLGYSKGENSYYYSYDVDGMRYQKVVNKNGVEAARYNYVYADGQLILLSYTANGTTQNAKFIYDSTGEVLGFIVAGATQYLYVKNLQGDIVAIVNETGVPVVRYIYDAWGNVTITTDSGYENLINLSPFAYRGYCYDNDIKMYYLQSRYYDPQICRFINADSSEYLGATGTVLSCNLFAYCENDPVDYIDPKGNKISEHFKTDWAGKEILKNYLWGKGKIRIYKSEKWANYMKNSEYLTATVQNWLLKNYVYAFEKSRCKIRRSIHIVLENGEGIIGYNYLHGSNSKVGDFRIEGKISVDSKGAFTFNLKYTWNDIIDPNLTYSTDVIKAVFGTAITLGNARPYVIRIQWSDVSVLKPKSKGGWKWTKGWFSE